MKQSLHLKLVLMSAILIIGVLGVRAAHAESDTMPTSAAASITFPIADLGNCANAQECKTYCDQIVNAQACAQFGQEHGLISSDDAAIGKNLQSVKTGPGGCASKSACMEYCSDPTHADACLKFATDHKLLNSEQLGKFKKLTQALKKGQTPGDCHDQNTCQTFCQQRSNNDKCLKFAKDAGLITKDDGDKISKFQAAITAGQTPGGCNSKDTCQAYCQDPTHRSECISFAQSMGLVTDQQAQKLQQGFTGPGGCDSKDSCESFCNDEANQQACLDFAKEHNVISKDDAKNIEDTKKSIENMPHGLPGQVVACLKQVTGDDNAMGQIQSGKFTPDSDTAAAIKACLQKAGADNPAQKPVTGFRLPPQIRDCVIKTYGEDKLKQIESAGTTAGLKDQIAKCLIAPPTGSDVKPPTNSTQTLPPPPPSGSGTGSTTFQLPLTLKYCILEHYGQDMLNQLQSGTVPTSNFKTLIPLCLPPPLTAPPPPTDSNTTAN